MNRKRRMRLARAAKIGVPLGVVWMLVCLFRTSAASVDTQYEVAVDHMFDPFVFTALIYLLLMSGEYVMRPYKLLTFALLDCLFIIPCLICLTGLGFAFSHSWAALLWTICGLISYVLVLAIVAALVVLCVGVPFVIRSYRARRMAAA